MSNETDTGGHAFPVPVGVVAGMEQGMTLLDWFAGQALAGILSIERAYENDGESEIAQWAYDHAEAMIEQKRKRESQQP